MSAITALIAVLAAIVLVLFVENRMRPVSEKTAAKSSDNRTTGTLLLELATELRLSPAPTEPERAERYQLERDGYTLELVPREQAWRATQPIAAVFALGPLHEGLTIAARDSSAAARGGQASERQAIPSQEQLAGGTGDPEIDSQLQLPVSPAAVPYLLIPSVRAAVRDLARCSSWRLDKGKLRFWLEPTVEASREAIERAIALARVIAAVDAQSMATVMAEVALGQSAGLTRALALLRVGPDKNLILALRGQPAPLPPQLRLVLDVWSPAPATPGGGPTELPVVALLPEIAWLQLWETHPQGVWSPYHALLARNLSERGSPAIMSAATRITIARDPAPTWLRRWLLDAPEANATACLGHSEWLARPDLCPIAAIALARPALTVPAATLLASTAGAEGLEWLQDALDSSKGSIARLAIEEAIERIKARLSAAAANSGPA